MYQYSIGGLVFTGGLVLAWKQGHVGMSGRAARNLVVLLGGLVVFAGLQGYLQYGPMEERAAISGAMMPSDTSASAHPLDYAVMAMYFAAILAIGMWAGRRQRTLNDFFFAGRRFSWWVIAFSLVATVVGSYSFVKYSRMGYEYGLSSSQTYLNDWFWMPLLWFSWLPLLYFSGVGSIPEYFQRRFGPRVRGWATALLLIYLVGYVGVNLYTMGTALHYMLGWPIPIAAIIVATVSGAYVVVGGQTSVIVTDLFQGAMLLVAGALILGLGAAELGGLHELWTHLPRSHRLAFANYNEDPAFPSVGIFWQDGMANTAMFYFLNQGVIMRFLSARHVEDGRRAMIAVPLVLMPVAACVVASGGWVGQALSHAGLLPTDLDPKEAFYFTTRLISQPGIYGFVLATLTAALMSTIDTLVTGVSAIVVNDIYRPYVRSNASSAHYLIVARITAASVMLLGLLLVPVYMGFRSIYSAHGAFTAAVTPPLVATFLLALLWRGCTTSGALASLVGGMFAIITSIAFPEIIAPFAHGVPATDPGQRGFLGGLHEYKFMRALFGLGASFGLGIAVSLVTAKSRADQILGLVWGTVDIALTSYRGRPGAAHTKLGCDASLRVDPAPTSADTPGETPSARVSSALATRLSCLVGDQIYVSDRRAWLGGLRSTHAAVGEIFDDAALVISMSPDAASTVGDRRCAGIVRVEHHYAEVERD